MKQEIKERIEQIGKGEVPKGYKKSKVGTIPDDWKVEKLGKYIKRLNAGVSVNTDGSEAKEDEKAVLKLSAIGNGIFYPKKNKKVPDKEIDNIRISVQANNLLITRKNTPELVGNVCYINNDYPNLYLPDLAWQTEFYENEKVNRRYLGEILNTSYYQYIIKKMATGTSNSMKNITKGNLLGLQIGLPENYSSQNSIETILSIWDKFIYKKEELIKLKKEQKKGLMQLLLTGKKRVIDPETGKEFEGEWKKKKLGELFTERKEVGYNDLQLLSIGSQGVYPQENSVKKDTSNSDKSKYKRICPDDIGYNTMRMWQGRSALSSLEGIVSPAYTIVSPKDNVCSQYFAYLFKMTDIIHLFYRNSQGLVGDTLNCKFKDFKIVKIVVPTQFEEQKTIANILSKADEEVKFMEEELFQLKEQKKGLMQLLLTGIIRV